jgi:5-amino-6-(5-phosphoribosylamino)uracil reductase
MRQLLPVSIDDVDPAEMIAALALGDRAPAHRPYTIANFVSSVDGRVSVDGGSTGLGDAGDKAIFRSLRGCADAVLAGTGTIGAEHYGALARDPAVAALRGRLGLAAQPALVTISRHGAIPAMPLLQDPGSRLIAYVGPDVEAPGDARAEVELVRRDPAQLTMSAVLGDLRARHGVRLLLCEGGPSIFGDLVGEGVCDELFLTLGARLVGGGGGAITRHLALDRPLDVTLLWALSQEASLYLRYGLTA